MRASTALRRLEARAGLQIARAAAAERSEAALVHRLASGDRAQVLRRMPWLAPRRPFVVHIATADTATTDLRHLSADLARLSRATRAALSEPERDYLRRALRGAA